MDANEVDDSTFFGGPDGATTAGFLATTGLDATAASFLSDAAAGAAFAEVAAATGVGAGAAPGSGNAAVLTVDAASGAIMPHAFFGATGAAAV